MVNTFRIHRLTWFSRWFLFVVARESLGASRSVAIVGGTLIDGTGRAAVTDRQS